MLAPPQPPTPAPAPASSTLPTLDDTKGVHLIHVPSLFVFGCKFGAPAATCAPVCKRHQKNVPKAVAADRNLSYAIAYFQTLEQTPMPYSADVTEAFFAPFVKDVYGMDVDSVAAQGKMRSVGITTVADEWRKNKKELALTDKQLQTAAKVIYGQHLEQNATV
ncbi:hypothetical protein BCR44DRAFT_246847 [Catenaria anguillulae PL171]|uniref:Uncharacterized protein n=1 Tax=Catenaria anguillulae PL171 TaxID=765915 RepID=A0A1Y2H6G1_9FUNG|nr:hypothetical protein BCR44DRAFT_246847 [Catenaria anguillulae PL171]